MPFIRKRRVPATQDSGSEDEAGPSTQRERAPRGTQRRASTPQSAEESQLVASDDDAATGGKGKSNALSAQQRQQLSKNLVRLALSTEYARQPLRRSDIGSKVLAPASQTRAFKQVFDDAQLALRQTFGMELVELAAKDKVTVSQRRAAQKSQASANGVGGTSQSQGGGGSAQKAWMLRTTLPEELRTSNILSASKIPSRELEAAYVGLYSFVVSVIALSGGSLAEANLDRYLKRGNADQSTPVDSTEKLLARMCKEGYIAKVKESNGVEETIEYYIGPRGKTEVGDEGVAGLVKAVYHRADADVTETEELSKKIERSLKVVAINRGNVESQSQAVDSQAEAGALGNRRAGRKRKSDANGRDGDDDYDG